MKLSFSLSLKALPLAAALAVLPLTAGAQSFGLKITGERPPETPQNFQEELPNTGRVDRGLVNGIARGGLNMVSPVAPAYYGDGRAYVSTYAKEESETNAYDGKEETGKLKGLKFFSIEW